MTCVKKLAQRIPPAAQNKGTDQLAPTVSAQSDVLLVNCTSIIESRCFSELLMLHRRKQSKLTMLLAKQPPPPTDPGVQPPPYDSDDIYDTIGIDEDTGQLLFFTAGIDVNSGVSIPLTVLSSHVSGGNISLHTDFKDVRAYMLSREVLDFVKKSKKEDFPSFASDVIPFFIRCQFFPEDAAKLPHASKKKVEAKASASAAEASARRYNIEFTEMDVCDSHLSRGVDVSDVKCFALVVDSSTVTCLRANTMIQYMLANKQIATGKSSIKPWEAQDKDRFISSGAQIDPKTQVGADCVIGDSSIGEKCGIRKSIIGKNCSIHPGAKVVNSVLMDDVVVMEGASITDSILCNGVHIDAKVTIKNCQLGAGYCATSDHVSEAVTKE